jgi:hypothetical protein
MVKSMVDPRRRPPWPWKGTPAEPFIYSGDAPLLVVKVRRVWRAGGCYAVDIKNICMVILQKYGYIMLHMYIYI